MIFHIFSYGTRHKLPSPAADLDISCKGIYNPYRIKDLRYKTGLDKEVKDNVLSVQRSFELLHKALVACAEAKDADFGIYVVAFRCTAGHHRSVVLAEELALKLRFRYPDEDDVHITVTHRDIAKP